MVDASHWDFCQEAAKRLEARVFQGSLENVAAFMEGRFGYPYLWYTEPAENGLTHANVASLCALPKSGMRCATALTEYSAVTKV
jgi:hypothetical protein